MRDRVNITCFRQPGDSLNWTSETPNTLRVYNGLLGLVSFSLYHYEVMVEVSPLLLTSGASCIILQNSRRIPLIHIPHKELIWRCGMCAIFLSDTTVLSMFIETEDVGKCRNCYFYIERNLDGAGSTLLGQVTNEKWLKIGTCTTTVVTCTSIQEPLELETSGRLFKAGRAGATEMSGESQASKPRWEGNFILAFSHSPSRFAHYGCDYK